MTRIITTLDDISERYDAVFCDLWGCLHDGIRPFPEAVQALQRFRTRGKVVLLTNSPRPRAGVAEQIEAMGVPNDCWDTIATSGDSARAAMFHGVVGRRVWHIGTKTDAPFFEPLHVLKDAVDIERVSRDEAEGIVCTGPVDPRADPETMRPEFEEARDRGLKLLCANPDIVVDRGERREWCAGALARLYTEIGGESLYFGKPHPPIYDLARMRLSEVGGAPHAQILAIGDGIATDIQGAIGEGLDALFVTGGLARAETGTVDQPEPDKLAHYLTEHTQHPAFAIGALR